MSKHRLFFSLAAGALAAIAPACVSAPPPDVSLDSIEASSLEASSLEDCTQTKDLSRAIAGCTEAIDARPKDAKLRVNRGFAHFLSGDLDRALIDYNEAIRLDANGPDAFARRGVVFRFRGEDDRAIADFTQAIALGAADPGVFVDRGTSHLAKGDNAKAIADYTVAIARDAEKTFMGQLALVLRGLAALYSDAPDRAQADFQRAVTLNPKEPFFALFLHLAERRTGSPASLPAAAPSLDMTKWPAPAIRMFLGEGPPDDVLAVRAGPVTICEAIYFTAEYMLLENRKDEAIRLYRKAVADCPVHILEGVAAGAALRSLGAG